MVQNISERTREKERESETVISTKSVKRISKGKIKVEAYFDFSLGDFTKITKLRLLQLLFFVTLFGKYY